MQSTQPSVLFTWLYAVACALQIYFDFSGYSDMAVGLGRIFGFHFPENFRYPFLSGSVTEFWRRWHISLGSWFRDYVYIPLGGQPLLPQPVATERVPCLGPDGPVARGGVEFRAVGPVFRRPAGGGKSCGTATGWKRPGS